MVVSFKFLVFQARNILPYYTIQQQQSFSEIPVFRKLSKYEINASWLLLWLCPYFGFSWNCPSVPLPYLFYTSGFRLCELGAQAQCFFLPFEDEKHQKRIKEAGPEEVQSSVSDCCFTVPLLALVSNHTEDLVLRFGRPMVLLSSTMGLANLLTYCV